MGFDDTIQRGFFLLKESNGLKVSINKINKPERNFEGRTLNNDHLLEWNVIRYCGLFYFTEEGLSGSFVLSEKGWLVATDFDWNYSDYKESIKPISRKLIQASTITNILVGVLIFFQLCVGLKQCSLDEQSLRDKSDIELLDKRLHNLEQKSQKQDFCHSCADR
jgi:hypothetical protein